MWTEQGIQMFWNYNRIGLSIMSEDPFDLDFAELIKVIDSNSKIPNMFVCS